MAALFISDLHLSPARPAMLDAFRALLRGRARQADALYVLGDLFDAWLGDDQPDADPLAAAVVKEFGALSDAGVALFFQHGNRDFLLREEFAHGTGGALLPEFCVRDLYGTPTLLLHGDQLCTDDRAYQEFRSQVRAREWQTRFLSLPWSERIAQARQLREASDAAKAEKSMAIMDANDGAVVQAFRAYAVPRMIHGHTHRPAHHLHEVDGKQCERYVLADWYESGSFLECDASGCRMHTMAPSQ